MRQCVFTLIKYVYCLSIQSCFFFFIAAIEVTTPTSATQDIPVPMAEPQPSDAVESVAAASVLVVVSFVVVSLVAVSLAVVSVGVVSDGVVSAGVAVTVGIQRCEVSFVTCIFDGDTAHGSHGCTVSCNSGRQYAIEHIDTAFYAFE